MSLSERVHKRRKKYFVKHTATKRGPPLEFINIQPQNGGPPLGTISMDLALPKAELLQLNDTQFPSLGILLVKKLEIEKSKTTFVICISFKSCLLVVPCFFLFPTFLFIKISREGN